MLSSVTYSCTALNGTNKVGLLKQLDNGYFRTVLGGLDVFNSSNELYPYKEAAELFERSGALQRRIARGALRAENGHPKFVTGMTNDDYANRIMNIHEDRVCAHISKIELVFDEIKDDKGRPIIAIVGDVAPAGELSYVLEKALKNPNENIAFSIRAFTEDRSTFKGRIRILRNIITWDYVGEPGIGIAEKYNSPSLESLEERIFSRSDLERVSRNLSNGPRNIATENARMNADELFRSLGWDMRTNDQRPKYLGW